MNTSHKESEDVIDLELDCNENEYIFKQSHPKLETQKRPGVSLTQLPSFSLLRNLASQSRPVLEIGCGYASTTKLLLDDGFSVIANDLEQKNLTDLFESVPDEETRRRLRLVRGDLMDLNFEEDFLNAIVGLNVIHFLSGSQIRDLFRQSFKWLAPNGILLFSAVTPYSLLDNKDKEVGKELLRSYYRNLRKNVEWPGEDHLMSDFFSTGIVKLEILHKYLPEKSHLLTAEILAREAILAGLKIIKLEYIDENESGYVESNKKDGNMHFVSIVCSKPEL
jgi:SAM-dependent methyltransferase